MSRPIYTEDGRRLYTTAQLAGELGVTAEAIRSRLHRQKAEPYTRLDARTPLWTLPKETTMTDTTVSREALVAWLGDRHGLTGARISYLRDRADEIGSQWPGADNKQNRLDRLWWAYQEIITADAPSKEEALDIIHSKDRKTGVDPWAVD